MCFRKRIAVWGMIAIILFPWNSRAECQADEESREQLIEQLEQCHMTDGGYRETNFFFLNMADPYASYYINRTKCIAGLEVTPEKVKLSYIFNCLSSQDKRRWNLMDTYSTVMLLDNPKELEPELYTAITEYLDMLYDEENGCYQFFIDSGDSNAVVPTYLVKESSEKLGEPIQPIDLWLQSLAKDAFGEALDQGTYIGSYAMLYELMQDYGFSIDTTGFESVIKIYEKQLDLISSGTGERDDLSDIPPMIMDLLRLCNDMGIDHVKYHDKIISLFSDQETFHEYYFWLYDYYNLYAIIYSLDMCSYPVNKHPWLLNEILAFDQFLLSDGVYISPSITEASVVPTYYADQLMDLLGLTLTHDNEEYCMSIATKGIQWENMNLWQIEMLISLLSKYDTDLSDESNREELESYLTEQWNRLLLTDTWDLSKLQIMNQLLSIDQNLNQTFMLEPSVQEQITNQILNETEKRTDDYEKLLSYIELVDFLQKNGYKNIDLIEELCIQIENNLSVLNNMEIYSKAEMEFRAVEVLEASDVIISDEVKKTIRNTLSAAYCGNGLYRSGDLPEDVITYQSTFYAYYLLDVIN